MTTPKPTKPRRGTITPPDESGAIIIRSRKRGTRAVATYPITELISYTGPIRGRRVADK